MLKSLFKGVATTVITQRGKGGRDGDGRGGQPDAADRVGAARDGAPAAGGI